MGQPISLQGWEMRTNGIFLAAALLVLAASANMADDGGVTSLASDIAHEVLNENSLGQLERANKDDMDLGESASVSDADVITDDLYYKPPPLSRSQVRRNNERWQKKGLQKFDGSGGGLTSGVPMGIVLCKAR